MTYNSAPDRPTTAKFGRQIQNDMPMTIHTVSGHNLAHDRGQGPISSPESSQQSPQIKCPHRAFGNGADYRRRDCQN